MIAQDLIHKIQKLRALAESTNVHEASNAAAAAEKLIAEHQLSEADLEVSAETKEQAEVSMDPLYVEPNKLDTWRWWLAAGLAKAYGVALTRNWARVKTKTAFYPYEEQKERCVQRMIGRKSDVEVMRYQYAFLTVEIERLTQLFLKSNTFHDNGRARIAANNFRLGAAEGVVAAMRDARKATVDAHCVATGSTSAALVLVSHAEDAEALKRRLHPELYKKNGKIRTGGGSSWRGDTAAREAGRAAGAGLHTSGALEGGNRKQLK